MRGIPQKGIQRTPCHCVFARGEPTETVRHHERSDATKLVKAAETYGSAHDDLSRTYYRSAEAGRSSALKRDQTTVSYFVNVLVTSWNDWGRAGTRTLVISQTRQSIAAPLKTRTAK